LLSRTTSPQASELRGGITLVENHDVLQRHIPELLGKEVVAGQRHIRPLLLAGDQRLFFSDSFIRRSVFHSAPMLTRIFNRSRQCL